MRKEYLWLRMGDNADYTREGSVEDLAETFVECGITNKLVRCMKAGITDNDKFKNLNYISLFYGDDDAQLIRLISDKELVELNKRIKILNKIVFYAVAVENSCYQIIVNPLSGEQLVADTVEEAVALREDQDYPEGLVILKCEVLDA